MRASVLVELLTEELPPKSLKNLGDVFGRQILNGLVRAGLTIVEPSRLAIFATPRRLAVLIPEVSPKAADRSESKKLMPTKVAFNSAGEPSQALLKRLEKEGASLDQLSRQKEGEAEYVFVRQTVIGLTLVEGLQRALIEAIEALPIPKVMTYQLDDGITDVKFVRPAHGLVALHGGDVIGLSALGLRADRNTKGHRFQGSQHICLDQADDYAEKLMSEGGVLPTFERRRENIDQQLRKLAGALGAGLGPDDSVAPLLDEVTALVEMPTVYVGEFESKFLAVPQECLILTMRQNQKYFPLFDAAGKLLNKFLIVSNMRLADPANIVQGNERVVRPRLADAQFFFEQDQKVRLADRVQRLAQIVYHSKLGSQLARTERVTRLAADIAAMLGVARGKAERAATLAKADLVTDMVGEFPELQGTMGRYYALHDGEDGEVADAIEQHYWPKFAGDRLPQQGIPLCVALADKLETLTGIWGIGLQPTGDKDPFGLRRNALAVVRMLASLRDHPLDLTQLLRSACGIFSPDQIAPDTAERLHDFILDRLRSQLREADYQADEIEAVVSQRPSRLDLVFPRLAAVRVFRTLPEAEALAAANKRIVNILRKANGNVSDHIDKSMFDQNAEFTLFAELERVAPEVDAHCDRAEFGEALKMLASLRGPVDRFFDDVLVMADDARVRGNRLALLASLSKAMNRVADISQLAT